MTGDPFGLLMSDRLNNDPFPVYDRIREGGGVRRSSAGPLVITSHAEASLVLRDQDWSIDPRAADPTMQLDETDIGLLTLDPPDHTRIRALVAPAFAPRRIEKMTQLTQQIAEELIAEAINSGTVEVMQGLAYPLPLAVIGCLLGIPPEHYPQIQDWGYRLAPRLDMTNSNVDQPRLQLNYDIDRYFQDLLSERRREPGDDMVSMLLQAQDDGAQITDRELLNLCSVLLLAGFVTTVNLIGNGLAALLDHPDQRAALWADPSLVPGAVEEMLRFDSPVQYTSRTATKEATIGGAHVRPRDPALVIIGAANRDPREFDQPDRFDVTRSNANRHLAFAGGIHHCIGAALARMEGKVLFETLVDMTSGIQPAGQATRRPVSNLRGYQALPIRALV